MLQTKKLVSLVMCISLPGVFWHTSLSAGVVDGYPLPNVLVQAERALVKGKTRRALDLLDGRIEYLRDADDQAQALALICQAQYQQQEYASAEKSCDAAVNTGRPNWSHFNNRGVMRFLLGRYGEALTDFHQAASIMVTASGQQSRSIRSNIIAAQRRLASL